jgi:phosphoglycerate dehydrogenase-like enzyme
MKLIIALLHRFELWRPPAWFEERLKKDFPQLEIVRLSDYEQLGPALRDADILLAWSVRPDQFAQASRLKWVHSTAAAVHQLMSPALVTSKVVVTNARDVHGPVVAEHALALMLALAKRLRTAFLAQQQREWAQAKIWDEHPLELNGSVVGIVGIGSIGSELAARCKALGMRVLAIREHADRKDKNVDETFAGSDLNRALAMCDFVVLAAPLTDKTKHMISAERLALMKPTAFLINVSRGPLIDDQALIAALRERKIKGAALDVFGEEPLPADSPYWSLPNCLITPHTAAVTDRDRLWERHYILFTDNLHRFLAGEPLRAIVDKHRGY